MISTLDRLYLTAYFRSYAIVLTCVLSLYVVIDLFTNLDSFGRVGGGVVGVASHIARYYSFQIALIFDRLADAITLLAAMFTISWMQRSNELLPQLSAGIPTRRVLRPLLIGSAITLSFGPLNQELIVPQISGQLTMPKDDPQGAKAQYVHGAFDPSGVHIEGIAGFRNQRKVLKFYATFPETSPNGMVHLAAEEAVYVPADGTPLSGGWLIKQSPTAVYDWPPDRLPANLKIVDHGKFFLYTQDVDFDVVSRGAVWFLYAPTLKLRDMLNRADSRRQPKVAVLFHTRLTRPIVAALLVVLGLSVILRDPNRHVLISSGLCLAIAVWVQLFVLGCKFLGDHSLISAPLAAWLPVLLFGPLTLVSFDSIHT